MRAQALLPRLLRGFGAVRVDTLPRAYPQCERPVTVATRNTVLNDSATKVSRVGVTSYRAKRMAGDPT